MLVTFYTYLNKSNQQQNSAGKATASKHQHWINRWTYNSPAYQYSSKNEEKPQGLDLVSDIPKFFQHACGIKKCLTQGRSLITYGFTGVQRVRKSGWKQKGTFPWNKSCWNIKIQTTETSVYYSMSLQAKPITVWCHSILCDSRQPLLWCDHTNCNLSNQLQQQLRTS